MTSASSTLEYLKRFDVYRASQAASVECVAICGAWPRGHAKLADQLRRASISVALNVAEGLSKRRPAEKRKAYDIAHAECTEAIAALHQALLLGLASEAAISGVMNILERSAAMLFVLQRRFDEP